MVTKCTSKRISIHIQRSPGCTVTSIVPAFTYASRLPVTRQPAGVLATVGYTRYLALVPPPVVSITNEIRYFTSYRAFSSGSQRCHVTTRALCCDSRRTILDIDQVGREARKNMREAYLFGCPRDDDLFRFEPTPITLGVIRGGDCGEILCPNTIRDLIDFSIRECVRREIPVRRCRSCGRYFPITGRITAEYCSRPSPSGKLCRSTAPVRKWAESRRSDQVFQEYRREYKRRFAWIKAGKLTEEQFAAWHKAAKARKKDCDREIISLDEFKSWLKNS